MSSLSVPAYSPPRAYRFHGLGDGAQDAIDARAQAAIDALSKETAWTDDYGDAETSDSPSPRTSSGSTLKRSLDTAGMSTRPNATARGTVNAGNERKARLEVSAGGGAMSKSQQDFMLALAIGQQKPKGPTGGQVLGWTLAAVAGLGLIALVARPPRR